MFLTSSISISQTRRMASRSVGDETASRRSSVRSASVFVLVNVSGASMFTIGIFVVAFLQTFYRTIASCPGPSTRGSSTWGVENSTWRLEPEQASATRPDIGNSSNISYIEFVFFMTNDSQFITIRLLWFVGIDFVCFTTKDSKFNAVRLNHTSWLKYLRN